MGGHFADVQLCIGWTHLEEYFATSWWGLATA